MDIKKDLHIKVEPVLKEAGSILLSYWSGPLEIHVKKQGFYTQADIASEQFLMRELTRIMPEATIWAEESGKSPDNGSGYRWVIDPLDGTTNFARHVPYFCISVALTYQDVPLYGAIYQPITQELFHAQHGLGAFLNGNRIQVSQKGDSLLKDIIALGLAYENEKRAKVVQYSQEIAQKAYAVRHTGAVALDCAYVAAGRFEGLIFAGLSWWDVAAGMLLIKEAGGKITTFEGDAIRPNFDTCIGGSPQAWHDLSAIIKLKKL